ncbi:SMI1/KNR4 family protein [Paraburkholderia ferrariae]|uniref:SMI1/KNR4 family protein n=1 Tax=Paraburkholderia ferrariae TaxID=386056 RepID=A0ABU9RMF3_9BURK
MNWIQEIAKLAYIKQVLAEADQRKLWPHHLPAVAATPAQIEAVEAALGTRLDRNYAELLLHADGWRGFYQTVDLFGTADLLGSEKMSAARELLGAVDDDVISATRNRRNDLLPIAATTQDRDLFVLTLPKAEAPGEVLWLAGELIDRFTNVGEFFLAMMDYNRLEVARFQKK